MLRMKAENPTRPWSDIIEATGFKDKGEAVARWKEIEHKNEEEANKQEQQKKKKPKDKDKDPDRAARDAKNREEGLKKKAEAKKTAETGGGDDGSKTEDKMVSLKIQDAHGSKEI